MLPAFTRSASFMPATADKEQRTVELMWSAGARVFIPGDWFDEPYFEELSMEPSAIRMDRMNSGACPLLDSHDRTSLKSVMGRIMGGKIQNGEGSCLSKFSKRTDVEPYFQDVIDGVISNVSVGYRVYKYQDISAPDDPVKVLRAIDWEPIEVSLVPVGADADAGVRSHSGTVVPCEIIERARSAQGDTMSVPKTTTPVETSPVVETPVAVQPAPAVSARAADDSAVNAERARSVEITQSVRKAGLSVNFAEELISSGMSADKARSMIIDKLAEKTASTTINPVIAGGTPANQESRNRSIEASLLHRSDPGKFKLEGDAIQFRGLTLMELARSVLESSGKRTAGLSKMEIATRAFEGTSDFPALLANVANKTLRDAYQAAPQTFRPIVKLNMSADFKQMSRIQLSDAPSLEVVGASGEVKRGALTDGKEVYSLATYAKIVAINRQSIINDDTSAFTRIPALMGRAASDLESDTVWNLILANAAMGDGTALFHADHKNLTGTGTAISVASLGVARALMKGQKNLQKRPMNIQPKFLICDPSIETLAEQAVGPIVPNAATSFNPFMGKYTILSEPRLTTGTTQPWYMAAEPGQIDVIEISYLEGQEGVYLESKQGFDVDGVEIKVRLDFAAKALDWRGLYKNAGV
jgi:hypothetical protein